MYIYIQCVQLATDIYIYSVSHSLPICIYTVCSTRYRYIYSVSHSPPIYIYIYIYTQCVPPAISLIILPLMRILQRNLKRTTDTFLFISHTTKVLLLKFGCSIFIGVRIIKEMPASVASGTHCILRGGYMSHVVILRCSLN